jgi:MoxR-like ATPase
MNVARPTNRAAATAVFRRIERQVETVIRGKPEAVQMAIACLVAEGHLLIEDKPGTGKTSLARAIAASIGGTAKRVQFTPDLLPSDITGVSIYNPQSRDFAFRPGPVFANVLVADEINRASPKTQAALLEVMEERQVTVDGVSHPSPRPFMVVATQNPLDFEGTYPLPEVQLDRFAMRISLGYTSRETELEVMASQNGSDPLTSIEPVVDVDAFAEAVAISRRVSVRPELREYVADVVTKTRQHPDLRLGVSTRGTLILLAVSRSLAIANARSFVTPDDIKLLLTPVLSHRMRVTPDAELDGLTAQDILLEIVDEVPVPRMRTPDPAAQRPRAAAGAAKRRAAPQDSVVGSAPHDSAVGEG